MKGFPEEKKLHFKSIIKWALWKSDIPCIQTGSRLPGTVWRGLIFFTTDRPDYHRMPPPAGDNHGWVVFAVRTGFALGHRASTFHACAHLITTAVRYQLRAQGRFSSLEPNMFGGDAGRSPGERPHDVIAGESQHRHQSLIFFFYPSSTMLNNVFKGSMTRLQNTGGGGGGGGGVLKKKYGHCHMVIVTLFCFVLICFDTFCFVL